MQKYINHLKKNKYSENTITTYRNILKIYAKDLHDIRLIKKRLSQYFSNANTAWTHYNVLCSFLYWSKDRRIDSLKEINMPKMTKKFMVVFKKDFLIKKTEISEFDDTQTINKKLLIRFLFETGLRSCEIKNIIEIKKHTIVVIGKGNKKREIFHNPNTTKRVTFSRVTTKTIRIWTKQILGKEYSPHSIRRSHATHMLTRGANPKMVMLQLGHEKVETTFRYLQLSLDENKKIYDKFF